MRADIRFLAQRRARDGCADQREVNARVVEILPDDPVLDVVERVRDPAHLRQGLGPGALDRNAQRLVDVADAFAFVVQVDELDGPGIIGVEPQSELAIPG